MRFPSTPDFTRFSGPSAGESVSSKMFSNGSCSTSFCFMVENTGGNHHESLTVAAIASADSDSANTPLLSDMSDVGQHIKNKQMTKPSKSVAAPGHSWWWMEVWRKSTQPSLPPLQRTVYHQKHGAGPCRHLVAVRGNCSLMPHTSWQSCKRDLKLTELFQQGDCGSSCRARVNISRNEIESMNTDRTMITCDH